MKNSKVHTMTNMCIRETQRFPSQMGLGWETSKVMVDLELPIRNREFTQKKNQLREEIWKSLSTLWMVPFGGQQVFLFLITTFRDFSFQKATGELGKKSSLLWYPAYVHCFGRKIDRKTHGSSTYQEELSCVYLFRLSDGVEEANSVQQCSVM